MAKNYQFERCELAMPFPSLKFILIPKRMPSFVPAAFAVQFTAVQHSMLVPALVDSEPFCFPPKGQRWALAHAGGADWPYHGKIFPRLAHKVRIIGLSSSFTVVNPFNGYFLFIGWEWVTVFVETLCLCLHLISGMSPVCDNNALVISFRLNYWWFRIDLRHFF